MHRANNFTDVSPLEMNSQLIYISLSSGCILLLLKFKLAVPRSRVLNLEYFRSDGIVFMT